jgi:predicted TPR repeat methyltransferase
MSEMENAPTSDDMVDIGEGHHKAGRLQEAEAYYRKAIETDPGHPGALYLLANIAYEDGRLPFSTQLTEELLRGEPNDAEAWHLLGMINLKQENLARAGECFNKALAVQPAYVQGHYGVGSVFSRQGDFNAALASFRQAVTLNPAFAEAHCSMGNIFQTQHKFEEALRSYQQAINVKSDFELAYESMGGVLLSQGKIDEAITTYRKAIAGNAGSSLIHVGLGTAHLLKHQNTDAAVAFERAIALDPQSFMAHFNLGNALFNQGKIREALAAYQKAVTLNPQDTRLFADLAKSHYFLGEIDKAAKVYREWLVREPDNPVARHHLAACTHEAVPTRAADAYVEHTFDAFADTFDVNLGALNYRGPQLLAEALQRTGGAARKQFSVLDAGCGTGLCGPLVASYAAQLTGVDLSAGMLAKAKLRNVYDALIKAELTAYLQSQAKVFDVILSADTLIYFGALESLFAAARTALRHGGHLFVTAEVFIADDVGSKSEQGYLLNPHGRYSHSEAYLRRTLSEAGFAIVTLETAVLRYEKGHPEQGFVISCRAIP